LELEKNEISPPQEGDLTFDIANMALPKARLKTVVSGPQR
jgi:hypothetical protein